MPPDECYLEVGTLEGRTIEAAAVGNENKRLFACDPGDKYGIQPADLPGNVMFFASPWQTVVQRGLSMPVGCIFYDGLHDAKETADFMAAVQPLLASNAILVLDDWDRESVRRGAFGGNHSWRLLRECPEWTDGLTCPPHYFGYHFGISIWSNG